MLGLQPSPAGGDASGRATDLEPARAAEREEKRLLARAAPLEDPTLSASLAALLSRLQGSGHGPASAPVRVLILRDPSRNGFSLPHGLIVLHTGLLARVDGENQLAMILAREIAQLGRTDTAGRVSDRRPAGRAHLWRGLKLDLAYQAAVTGPGETAEREADAQAVERLERTGFDTAEGGRVFEALRRGLAEEHQRESFLLGNPRFLDDRRQSLATLVGGRPLAVVQGGGDGAQRFGQSLRVAVRENALLEAQAGRFTAARAQLARALRLAPGDPVAHVYDGDLLRLQAQRRHRAEEREGLRNEARTAYERAALLAPDYPEPFRHLGLLYFETAQYRAAREAFERYLALASDRPDARRVKEYVELLGE